MRLWSIHPVYLDSAGLTACWREALLARKVLEGKTKGYKNHPQLLRFKQAAAPLAAIEAYLGLILDESLKRGFHYDASKVRERLSVEHKIAVTDGQLIYEFEHLKRKLRERNIAQYEKLLAVIDIMPNPIFTVVKGGVENWEVTNENSN